MDLTEYRNSAAEQGRIADLMQLAPANGETALDIGARDGYISCRLADRFAHVTALDMTLPEIAHERVTCVQGDVTALKFGDRAFDLVLCAEVLEHIPPSMLADACHELARVTRGHLLIGVPYRQDIRVGRTTCNACGGTNPPWGHVNTFDERRLAGLFPGFHVCRQSLVGITDAATNALSSWLMDLAGNPYGTYDQEEPCGHCGASLTPPPKRAPWQRIATRLAFIAQRLQQPFVVPHGNWIHVLLAREAH